MQTPSNPEKRILFRIQIVGSVQIAINGGRVRGIKYQGKMKMPLVKGAKRQTRGTEEYKAALVRHSCSTRGQTSSCSRGNCGRNLLNA